MQNFTLYTPTEIIFGKDTENKTGELVKKYCGEKVMVVYGGGSVVKSGLLQKVTDQLKNENIDFLIFGGAKPNPRLSHARDGVKQAIAFNADFILAVGGGSAIDTAKGIALGAKNPDIDIWKFWKREETVTKALPIGVILTISAAGSETSNSAVLTDESATEKRGLTSDTLRPCFAVMNPELTFSLPVYQIACGITDIMMHTLERYFTQTGGNELTDEIASALLRTVVRNGKDAVTNPYNYHAMSEIMWCGSLSHNGLTGLGRPMDFSVHQLGHEIGAKFDKAHGATLAAMWGSWAKYCCHTDILRFSYYAENVWNIIDEDPVKAAEHAIEATLEFFRSIGMPTCFSELGIGILDYDTIEKMADSCVFHGKRLVGNFKVLNKEDIINIYKMANR